MELYKDEGFSLIKEKKNLRIWTTRNTVGNILHYDGKPKFDVGIHTHFTDQIKNLSLIKTNLLSKIKSSNTITYNLKIKQTKKKMEMDSLSLTFFFVNKFHQKNFFAAASF